jgi:hypothetical protein
MRNPLTGAITRRGRSACWNAEPRELDPVKDRARVESLRSTLRLYELAGEVVEWDHGSSKRTAESQPSLF